MTMGEPRSHDPHVEGARNRSNNRGIAPCRITGTIPADDTRLSSSNLTDTAPAV